MSADQLIVRPAREALEMARGGGAERNLCKSPGAVRPPLSSANGKGVVFRSLNPNGGGRGGGAGLASGQCQSPAGYGGDRTNHMVRISKEEAEGGTRVGI